MSPFNKQHLIFMPESGQQSFKITKELTTQDKHVSASCQSCKSRVNSLHINPQASPIHFAIMKHQSECSKIWKETVENISKGKLSNRTNNNVNDVVICLDEDTDNDNETMPRQVLPRLSPMPNNIPKTPVVNSKPNASLLKTPTPSKTSTPLRKKSETITLDSTLNVVDSTSPGFGNDEVKVISNLEKQMTPALVKKFIYSNRACCEDHVFYVNRYNHKVKQDRLRINQLNVKVKQAQRGGITRLANKLQSELYRKEQAFAVSHIKKVEFNENASLCHEMVDTVRDEIYDSNRTRPGGSGMFELKSSSEQEAALNALIELRNNVCILQQMENKFASNVANELHHREYLYRTSYLTLKPGTQAPPLPLIVPLAAQRESAIRKVIVQKRNEQETQRKKNRELKKQRRKERLREMMSAKTQKVLEHRRNKKKAEDSNDTQLPSEQPVAIISGGPDVPMVVDSIPSPRETSAQSNLVIVSHQQAAPPSAPTLHPFRSKFQPYKSPFKPL